MFRTICMRFKNYTTLTKLNLSVGNAALPLFSYVYLSVDKDCFDLTKALAVFSGSLTMAMATQVSNQSLEIKQDKLMTRTCNRPLPTNKISRGMAGVAITALFCCSNAIFYNLLPAQSTLVANCIFFTYTFIYTPLKQISPVNTIVGAVVGALSPLVGAYAVDTDDFILPASQVLFMFTWQFNHFYGIYWKYQADYERALFKMLNDPKKAATYMKINLPLNMLSWAGVAYAMDSQLLLPIILLAGAYSNYEWNWKSIKKFAESPNANADQLKKCSYRNFTLFYLVQMLALTYKKTYEQKEF